LFERSVEVHLGAHNMSDLSEEGRVVVESSQIIIHEDYVANFGRNSLALVILPEPVSGPSKKMAFVGRIVYNESQTFLDIEAIRLPSRSSVGQTLEGETIVFTGWGKQSRDIGIIYSCF